MRSRPPRARRRRRTSPLAGVRRWATVAMVAWLALILSGREHVLQAVGLEIACVHPAEGANHARALAHERADAARTPHVDLDGARPLHDGIAVQAAAAPDDRAALTSADLDADDDCPVGCDGCACGGMLFALSAATAELERPWSDLRHAAPWPGEAPRGCADSVERPPRRA